MTYYGTFGELILVCSLIYISYIWHKSVTIPPLFKHITLVCFAVIAITALLGSARFAGVNSVIPTHDTLSWISKHIAMLLYAAGLAYTVINYKAKIVLVVIVLIAMSQLLGTLGVDLVLFVSLLFYAFFTQVKPPSIFALIALLLVPTTAILPVSDDFKMGLFHLLLALHFFFIALSIKIQKHQHLV